MMDQLEVAYLAGGCFWGLQELIRDLNGVDQTVVGYCGGQNNQPTYENHPGHAETVKILFKPKVISYLELLDYFFRIHDPTTLNRQGNDYGSSYRSAIFYTTNLQKDQAKEVIKQVNLSKLYDQAVVTSLEKFKTFYLAEDYHQDYLRKHPAGYTCHYLRSSQPII